MIPAVGSYLNDHSAGATAGANLAKMAAREHQTDEHGPFFSEIYAEIQADFDTLQQLADELGVEKSAGKSALAEVGSKMMGPRFTGGDDDELNALVTLETLSIGVEGKVCVEGAEDRGVRLPRVRRIRHRRPARPRDLAAREDRGAAPEAGFPRAEAHRPRVAPRRMSPAR